MGHAGALISGGADTADAKLEVMEACGIRTTRNPSEMGKLLKSVLEIPCPYRGRQNIRKAERNYNERNFARTQQECRRARTKTVSTIFVFIIHSFGLS
ncbi:hypothetical protein G6F57_022810 [Rhizopus arrhizus]|nr:hypothetical protein G6F57_022810 [Rhizopus arrhizus]